MNVQQMEWVKTHGAEEKWLRNAGICPVHAAVNQNSNYCKNKFTITKCLFLGESGMGEREGQRESKSLHIQFGGCS